MTQAKQLFDAWADNSNPNDIDFGIIGFSRALFPREIEPKYGIPDIHKHMYMHTLSLYHPDRIMMPDRQLQYELARDSSKSTLGCYIIPLYLACYNGLKIKIPSLDYATYRESLLWGNMSERFEQLCEYLVDYNGIEVELNEDVIMIMSETFNSAENWTDRIRAELATNSTLKAVFGSMKPDKIMDEDGKWTRGAFTVRKEKLSLLPWQQGRDVTIVSKGVNQQSRGFNKRGRTTFYIGDDLYSAKTSKTLETRQKTRYIYSAEVKYGIDANKGKLLCIGTVVHEDTVVIDNERNRRIKTIKYPAMDKDKFMYILNKYCVIDSEKRICHIPDAKKCRELEESGFLTNWPERLSLFLLLSQYSEAFEGKSEGRTLSMFWQEKFHETLAEDDKKFKRAQMKDLKFELIHDFVNGNHVDFLKIYNQDGSFFYRNVNSVISIDCATSFEIGSDDSAIVWMCKDHQGRLYFYKYRFGKFGINDSFKDKSDEGVYLDKLCMDYNKIENIGISDEIFRWLDANIKHKLKIVVEVNHVGSEADRAILRKMRLYKVYYPTIEVCNTMIKKIDRIYDNLSPYCEAGYMYFNDEYNWEPLKHQLEYLGKTSKDDIADAASTGAPHLDSPAHNYSELGKSPIKKQKTIVQLRNLNNLIKSYRDNWRLR